jgi:hypothetical protein
VSLLERLEKELDEVHGAGSAVSVDGGRGGVTVALWSRSGAELHRTTTHRTRDGAVTEARRLLASSEVRRRAPTEEP